MGFDLTYEPFSVVQSGVPQRTHFGVKIFSFLFGHVFAVVRFCRIVLPHAHASFMNQPSLLQHQLRTVTQCIFHHDVLQFGQRNDPLTVLMHWEEEEKW